MEKISTPAFTKLSDLSDPIIPICVCVVYDHMDSFVPRMGTEVFVPQAILSASLGQQGESLTLCLGITVFGPEAGN